MFFVSNYIEIGKFIFTFVSTLRDIIYQTLDFPFLDFQLKSFVDPKPVEL